MNYNLTQIPDYFIVFLIFILFLFGFFSVLYIVQIPPFEGHDEIAHYYRVIDGRRVFNAPVSLNTQDIPLADERVEEIIYLQNNLERIYFPFTERTLLSHYQFYQPPIYYDILGLIAGKPSKTGIDIFVNPYFFDGYPNLFYHLQDIEEYENLSSHLRSLRVFSSFILLLCVLVFFLLLQEVFLNRSLLIFTGLFILLSIPQLVFIGSIINNDILSVFFAFASIYLFTVLVNNDFKNPIALLLLLIILPIGMFVKITYIIVIISFFIYVLFFWKKLKYSYILSIFGFVLFLLLAIYAFDHRYLLRLYTSFRLYIYNITQMELYDYNIINIIKEIFKSFFGVFGWKNIYMRRFDHIIYFLISLFFIFSFFRGFYLYLIKKHEKPQIFILNAIIILTNIFIFLIYFLVSQQPQGRFLFVSIPSLIIISLMNMKNNKTLIIICCILFCLWGIYINSYITCKLLPDHYSSNEPLFLAQSIKESTVFIIPGRGFRYLNDAIYYYDLSIIDIYSKSELRNIELVFTYSHTDLSRHKKHQYLIPASGESVLQSEAESNEIVYSLGQIISGRNRYYIYNKFSSDITDFHYKNSKLINIQLR